MLKRCLVLGAMAGGAGTAYVLTVKGALVLDLGLGRRVRPLGPQRLHIAAPPDTVFDVIAGPYLGRTPRAMAGELDVLVRGSDFEYSGELGTDLWRAGRWWGDRVAARWERAVAVSLDGIRAESERRARL